MDAGAAAECVRPAGAVSGMVGRAEEAVRGACSGGEAAAVLVVGEAEGESMGGGAAGEAAAGGDVAYVRGPAGRDECSRPRGPMTGAAAVALSSSGAKGVGMGGRGAVDAAVPSALRCCSGVDALRDIGSRARGARALALRRWRNRGLLRTPSNGKDACVEAVMFVLMGRGSGRWVGQRVVSCIFGARMEWHGVALSQPQSRWYMWQPMGEATRHVC